MKKDLYEILRRGSRAALRCWWRHLKEGIPYNRGCAKLYYDQRGKTLITGYEPTASTWYYRDDGTLWLLFSIENIEANKQLKFKDFLNDHEVWMGLHKIVCEIKEQAHRKDVHI